jgi:hypothetical protein
MSDYQSMGHSPTSARFYGIVTIMAPLLLLASTVAYVSAGEGINHGVLGGVIGVWSCFTFALTFVGLARTLEPWAPRAAVTLTLIGVVGFTAGAGFNVDAIQRAISGPAPDGAFEAAISGAEPVVLLAFLPWGWFAPLAFILAGIFLWRARLVSWWSGALLIAGGVLFVTARPARVDLVAILGDGLLVLALVPIGLAMLASARAVPSRTAAVG